MKYILLRRSYSTGKGNYMNFHKGWRLEVKANQKIQGIEFSTKLGLNPLLIEAVQDIAEISEEKLNQDFRQALSKICADEFEKLLKKPNLSNIKRLIKNVLSKIEKAELNNRIVESKIFRIKRAMEVIK
jgi:polyribonucleotide nucleotidyltransferase